MSFQTVNVVLYIFMICLQIFRFFLRFASTRSTLIYSAFTRNSTLIKICKFHVCFTTYGSFITVRTTKEKKNCPTKSRSVFCSQLPVARVHYHFFFVVNTTHWMLLAICRHWQSVILINDVFNVDRGLVPLFRLYYTLNCVRYFRCCVFVVPQERDMVTQNICQHI